MLSRNFEKRRSDIQFLRLKKKAVYRLVLIYMCKVLPITGHEGPEGE